MFCPKCGTENPTDGKYCRKCGCDLKLVSEVISGKLTVRDDGKIRKNKRKPTWEEVLTLLFISVAFFIISIFLAFQPIGIGWWFWLLIPAFATMAPGIGKLIELRQYEKNDLNSGSDENAALRGSSTANALPPQQTAFVSDIFDPSRDPGDRVPVSVVEGTTRHLDMDRVADTTELPETDE